eukprot:TRINITY_DN5187_c0_g1_i4.p1 TRINITY_DN5187_c0_g1~~TRINITY_DN5187_c0_g1_i4.p1  ORF type:complete len:201 (-),score=51.46 TRINITY_DN5187_c0_g1_i4:157-759(-)
MFFCDSNAPLWKPLKDVLVCFAMFRPDIGYVQGMSYIGAMMLMNHQTPQETFVSFANLISSPFLTSMFKFDASRNSDYFAFFEILLYKNCPDLHTLFWKLEISFDFFLYEWFLTLFTKPLSLEVAARVIDNYLVHGTSFLFRTAVGILDFISCSLTNDFETCILALTKIPRGITEQELFDCIAKIGVSPEDMQILQSLEL